MELQIEPHAEYNIFWPYLELYIIHFNYIILTSTYRWWIIWRKGLTGVSCRRHYMLIIKSADLTNIPQFNFLTGIYSLLILSTCRWWIWWRRASARQERAADDNPHAECQARWPQHVQWAHHQAWCRAATGLEWHWAVCGPRWHCHQDQVTQWEGHAVPHHI